LESLLGRKHKSLDTNCEGGPNIHKIAAVHGIVFSSGRLDRMEEKKKKVTAWDVERAPEE